MELQITNNIKFFYEYFISAAESKFMPKYYADDESKYTFLEDQSIYVSKEQIEN